MIKNPSLQELELKLKDYRTVANSDGLSVGLKFDKDVTMGIVQDVKEVFGKLYPINNALLHLRYTQLLIYSRFVHESTNRL